MGLGGWDHRSRCRHFAVALSMRPCNIFWHECRDRDQQALGVSSALDDVGFVQGAAAQPVARPPAVLPGSASSRETPSQRAKLQALHNKPRVRNYNIKQDGR